MANKTKLEINIVSPKDNESTVPKDQEPVSPKPGEENLVPAENKPAENKPADKTTEIRPTETEEGIVAEAPNTGFNLPNFGAYTTKAYIISGFFLVLIAAIIVYKLINKVNQKNKKDRVSLKVKRNKLTKILPIISFLFLGLLLSLDSFATNNLRVNVYPSRNVSFEADILTTNDIKYVHDEILIPSTSFGYKVSIFTDNDTAELVNKEDNSLTISSIKIPGKLSDNEFGYTLEEPTKDTIWYPIGTNSSHTEIFNQSGSVEAQTIDIWYGVKAGDQQSGTYTISLDFIGTTNEVIFDMQNMDSSVCNALIESETYKFKDTRDGKEYNVSKLKDGNCWMTENLATELTIQNGVVGTNNNGTFTKFDNENTDLKNSEWTTTQESFEPESEEENWTVDYMDEGYGEALRKVRSTKIVDEETGESNVYYNYAAAKAGDLDFTVPDGAPTKNIEYSDDGHWFYGEAPVFSAGESSICPKGWTLPSSTQYNNLVSNYGPDEYEGDIESNGYWPVELLKGFANTGRIKRGQYAESVEGNWSSNYHLTSDIVKAGEDLAGYFLHLSIDEDYYEIYLDSQNYGYGAAARCVAKPDKITVIYDENADGPVKTFPARIAEYETETEIHIDETAPEREGYLFLGWATTADGEPTYNPNDIIPAGMSTLTLYAKWIKEIPNVHSLQDFDQAACISLEEGEVYPLIDERDGKSYNVSRLSDGNCWMMENLDLDLSPETPLTPELTDIDEEWRPDFATSTDPEEEWYRISDYEYNYNEARSFDAGSKSIGNHYNIIAASAGSVILEDDHYDLKFTAAGNSSICPKNWHLASKNEYFNIFSMFGRFHTYDRGSYADIQMDEPNSNFFKFMGDFNGVYDYSSYSLEDNNRKYASFVAKDDFLTFREYNEGYLIDEGNKDDKDSKDVFAGGAIRCVTSVSEATLDYLSNDDGVSGLPASDKKTVGRETAFFEVSSDIPTREGYIFAGWSKTPERNGGTIYHPGDKIRIASPELKLYALWLKELNLTVDGSNVKVETLQQFGTLEAEDTEENLCSALDEEIDYGLRDTRDNKVYSIKKLIDGKCWMTQNLALDPGKTITPSDSNVEENWTLPASSSDDRWTDYYPQIHKEDGEVYYSWTAAVAKDNSSGLDENQDMTTSICPKGWHLPIVSDRQEDNEFYALINPYRTGNYYDMDETINLAEFPLKNMVGYYEGFIYNQNYDGHFWSSRGGYRGYGETLRIRVTGGYRTSTERANLGLSVRCVLDTYYNRTLEFSAGEVGEDAVSGIPAPETITATRPKIEFVIPETEPERNGYIFAGWSAGDGTVYHAGDKIIVDIETKTLYAVWHGIAPISTLQALTAEICASLTEDLNYDLRDSRDNKMYSIAKLRDGKCWMTQNLALDSGITLDSTNTNLEEGETFTLPASSNSYNDWDSSSQNNTQPRMLKENGKYYYNWTAAIAKNDSSSLTTEGQNATTSICPKGWHLPTGGNDNSNEFQTLINQYPYGYSRQWFGEPISFTPAGYRYYSSISSQDDADLWSSSTGTVSEYWFGTEYKAYNLDVFNSGYIYAYNQEHRHAGLSVRCVFGEHPAAVSSSSSTSSASTSVESNTSSPSTAYNYSYNNNYNYNYYGEGADLPELEEKPEEDSNSPEKIKDKDLEDDKTAPLGVVKRTKEQEKFDPISIIVISASIILVLLGITAIVVIEKRNND